jgi:hypothetical protein
MASHFDFDRTVRGPFEFVTLDSPARGGWQADSPLPEEERTRILVHTVHDGTWIPHQFRFLDDGTPRVSPDALARAFVRERDWGANLVAHALAKELGLDGYGRVTVARVLLDFNRFPGTTLPGNEDPLRRFAINPPFSSELAHPLKMRALELYDQISDAFEPLLPGKLIVLGVHTYDELNPSLTSRPHLSVVSQAAGYQQDARMPYGVFDPLYPDVLGESSCSRVLRDRISLSLERGGFRVSANHPYALPEGSIEIRAQVWYFFKYVRDRFEQENPQTVGSPVYAPVWAMLLNTNLRQAHGEALRGYLHRFRKPDEIDRKLFEAAQVAYEDVRAFMADGSVLQDYRRSPDRPSCLGLEVRKDLLCEPSLEPGGHPRPATDLMRRRADVIAELVADAIRAFLREDRGEPPQRGDVVP